MIPGTKARNQNESSSQHAVSEKIARPQMSDPSTRNYSRRDLFRKFPDLFGEGLVKILRTSNHLETGLRSKLTDKRP